MDLNLLRDIRAKKKEKFLFSLLEKLATTVPAKTELAKLTSFHRSEEDDLDNQDNDDDVQFTLKVHGHSGYLDHEIEKKAADYKLDMRKCVQHDGSRAYQLDELTPEGTEDEYKTQVNKQPPVWKICASSQRMYASTEQECIRRNINGTVNWRDTLQEYNEFQNTHRYHKTIRRLALRDMATLIYPDHRELFHRQEEKDIIKFLLSMDVRKTERNKYREIIMQLRRTPEQDFRQAFTLADSNYREYRILEKQRTCSTADDKKNVLNTFKMSYDRGTDDFDYQYLMFCIHTISNYCTKSLVDYIGTLIRQETEAGTEVLFSELLTIVKKQEAKPTENRPTVMMKLNWTGDEPLAVSTTTIKLNNINISQQEKFRNEQRFRHGLPEAQFPIRGTLQEELEDSLKTSMMENTEIQGTPPNDQIPTDTIADVIRPNITAPIINQETQKYQSKNTQQLSTPENTSTTPEATNQHPLQQEMMTIIPQTIKFKDKPTGVAYTTLLTMATKEDDPQHVVTENEVYKRGVLGKVFTDNLSNHERQILGAENVEQINSGELPAKQLAELIKNTSKTSIKPQGILSSERSHTDTTPATLQTPPRDKTFVKDFPDISSWHRNQELMEQFSVDSPANQPIELNTMHQTPQIQRLGT